MMTVNVRKVFAIALVLVALVSIFVPTASAGTGTWYLCTDTPDPSLSKTAPGDGPVSLTDGKDIDWTSELAQCSLTIGEGTWTLDLNYTAPAGTGDEGTVDIDVWRTGAEPYLEIGKEHGVALPTGSGNTSIEVAGSTMDFTNDKDFCVYITWHEGGDAGSLTVNCGDGKSKLKTPSSDPGFPVPEMSTLVLFSVGLLALVGYVAYRRRDI